MKSAVLVLLFLMCAQTADAQFGLFKRFEVSGGVGASFPLGAFNDSSSVGYQYGANLGFYFTPRSVVGLAFDLYNNGISDEYREAKMASDGDFSSWQLALYYKQYLLFSNLNPYVRLQAGIFRVDTTIDGRKIDGLEAEYALTGGLGVQIRRILPIAGFAEFLFTRVIVNEQNPQEESDLRTFLSLHDAGPSSCSAFSRSSRSDVCAVAAT